MNTTSKPMHSPTLGGVGLTLDKVTDTNSKGLVVVAEHSLVRPTCKSTKMLTTANHFS